MKGYRIFNSMMFLYGSHFQSQELCITVVMLGADKKKAQGSHVTGRSQHYGQLKMIKIIPRAEHS